MAMLTINGIQYEAKANFKFERLADKKYKGEKEEVSALEKIYQDLMSYKIGALIKFWDCATAQHGKNQPSVEQIEDALTQVIENDEDATEQLFKDAFQTMDKSGFFKLQLKEFWKNLDMIEKFAEDEKEMKKGEAAKEMFLNRRKELLN
ncbi:tail assembly chaperone [Priestia flexa]|uniref:tail assembly chaperone n=1 Tax=Priestia flexa TaxID=86664 RepID=UPI001CFCCC00|nr:tail assembly chaperone [Priestia flexa]